MINFAGIVDNSTIDYPGKLCAVIYLCGCSYRCPFCHNKNLVFNDPKVCKKVEISEIVDKIKQNFLIDAVCITGGEPLLQQETIELIKQLKNTKSVKLDTNMDFPENLKKAIDLVDFISVDIKSSFGKYDETTGTDANIDNIKRSLEILRNSNIPKEARTTIVPGLNDSSVIIENICKIVKDIGFNYYTIQQFRPKNTLDPKFEDLKPPSYEKMYVLGDVAKKNLSGIIVRLTTLEKGTEIL